MGGFIAGLIIVAVVSVIGLFIYQDADQQNRVDAAKEKAALLCRAHGGAETYDVQDQPRLVYACRSDMRLKTLDYGSALP
jgi:hypothetical protein